MTREEAIMILENNRPSCGERIIFKESEVYEAMSMAIEALRQPEPRSFSCGQENDVINRRAAIDAVCDAFCYAYCDNCEKEMDENLCGDCHRKYQNWSASRKTVEKVINVLPSAQPDTSRIENILHGKSPEEQYDLLYWLMCTYAMQYTDSREAVIAWLGAFMKGE